MTDSPSQPNNKGTRLFLGMIARKKNKNTTSTSPDPSCTTSKDKVTGSLNDTSARSQSTAATDISSVVSIDDSTHASSEFVNHSSHDEGARRRPSALKREKSSRRDRLRQNYVQRIQFNPTVQEQWHLALHEYTKEECEACWYRARQYHKIARSCLKEIKMLERGLKTLVHDDDRRYCVRGLESHTGLAMLARNQNRLDARTAVFDEQRVQLSMGVIDDEAIASQYRDVSWSSMLWAIRVGQQDQREAELVYDSMLD